MTDDNAPQAFIIHSNLPMPTKHQLYQVGSNPAGGRRSRFPFRTMDVSQAADIILRPPAERAKHRGQIMAAIRATISRYPTRRFSVEDIPANLTSDPPTPAILRVWRFK